MPKKRDRKPGRPAGRTYSIPVTVKLDPDLHHALTQMARSEDRPLAALIRVILRVGAGIPDATKSARD